MSDAVVVIMSTMSKNYPILCIFSLVAQVQNKAHWLEDSTFQVVSSFLHFVLKQSRNNDYYCARRHEGKRTNMELASGFFLGEILHCGLTNSFAK